MRNNNYKNIQKYAKHLTSFRIKISCYVPFICEKKLFFPSDKLLKCNSISFIGDWGVSNTASPPVMRDNALCLNNVPCLLGCLSILSIRPKANANSPLIGGPWNIYAGVV